MNPDSPEFGPQADQRVSSLVNEYFDRRQAGENLTPEGLVAAHPEVTGELKPYLAGLAIVEKARALAEATAAQPSSSAAELPTITGFQLMEEIGRGGMGVVYRALQQSTKRAVALKVMLAGQFASASARRRFEREVELAARLQHAGIVRVLESGESAGQRYYAMDYVVGVRLDHYLAASRPDVRATLDLFTQICAAVECAHAHGVVHRDLKPGNVLIDDEGHPHILDFGLAKATDQADSEEAVSTCVSLPGQVVGTLFYLSPEQAAGAPVEVDRRTDVYALGVMLFEALTGSLPLDTAGRPSEVLRRILEVAPTPPSSLSSRVRAELETIILKALAKEKERRYQSVAELTDDIRRYLTGEPILARRPSSLYVLRKKLIKHRLAAGAVAAVLVLTIVGLGYRALARQREWASARAQAVKAMRDLEWYGSSNALGPAEVGYRRHPDLPEACLVWAQAQYANSGTRSESIRLLEGKLRDDASQWAYRALLAEIYRAAGETDRATALQTQADREAADTPEGWYLRSFATLDRAQATRCAGEAVRRQPDHTLAWERLTWLRLLIGDLNGAYEAADRVIQLRGDAVNWMAFKGAILARQGQFEAAVAEYTRLMALKPRSSDAYRSRAHVYRRLKRYAESVDDYSKALELDGETTANVWDLYQRATPLWILGRSGKAAEDYHRVRVLLGRPFYADARRFLILREQSRADEAEQVLKGALQDVQDEWLRQIFRCLDGQLTPESMVDYARTRGNREQLCEAYYYAGEVCRLAGRSAEARAWLTQCVQTGVQYDLQAFPLTPMNEYELAQWRLETLPADQNPASHPENP